MLGYSEYVNIYGAVFELEFLYGHYCLTCGEVDKIDITDGNQKEQLVWCGGECADR